LKSVSLDILAGESLGVIGRNGVGKTTLLRVLADIIAPNGGSFENFGATTAMLSLQVGFDPQASGRTNILLSALLLGYTKIEIQEKTDEIIAFSELGEFIDQPLAGYSMGMRARLGFSVCYFMQPDVLLIDEALGVGDLEFREKSTKAMQEKIKSDQTVVLVSHSANTIRQLCNRAVWIEDGVSRMDGDVDEVVESYESFVRSNPRTNI
jgi:lipopolysaccharide transport system ATP-binding protein